jgi:hypothetical protein
VSWLPIRGQSMAKRLKNKFPPIAIKFVGGIDMYIPVPRAETGGFRWSKENISLFCHRADKMQL